MLTAIGDISVGGSWVQIPTGRFPIKGSVWTVQDFSRNEEKISTVGIVLAVLFIWLCFLSLLFLLMKERRVTGHVQVTVQGQGFHHSTMIPAVSAQTFFQVSQQVNYVRGLAA
ncbi:hypothetical protein FHP29_14380 [Nocardioides albidus]|uniref:Uncharacterized protein n=1 Tax=Nocardioides albidus TaxID=1517589 RepID=A0A5C4VTG8_9ACTN|nr:hypothetical protein FHP29_14380 [Nocardioides albidus]